MLNFFSTGLVVHHHLTLPEKLELGYVFDYFGINLDENTMYVTLNELRSNLIEYALFSNDVVTVDLVNYLIHDLNSELVGSYISSC